MVVERGRGSNTRGGFTGQGRRSEKKNEMGAGYHVRHTCRKKEVKRKRAVRSCDKHMRGKSEIWDGC